MKVQQESHDIVWNQIMMREELSLFQTITVTDTLDKNNNRSVVLKFLGS